MNTQFAENLTAFGLKKQPSMHVLAFSVWRHLFNDGTAASNMIGVITVLTLQCTLLIDNNRLGYDCYHVQIESNQTLLFQQQQHIILLRTIIAFGAFQLTISLLQNNWQT